MVTSTIVLQGKVVVEDVLFSWWVTDGGTPRLTVSHPAYGTETRPLGDTEPRGQARTLAKGMLESKRGPENGAPQLESRPEATIVLGEDYRHNVESNDRRKRGTD